MLALAGAVVFALALILDWANATVSDAFTPQTLLFLGPLLGSLIRPVGVAYCFT